MFRRIATILLLTFLLFNWAGYWLFINWYESREETRWASRLNDQQYDRGQLILFKVSAAAIPYSNNSADFQQAEGELEVGNIHYRYVQKRLYNDSIEFLCLRDCETGQLQRAKREIIHLAVDVPDGNDRGRTSPAGKITPPLLTVFYQQDPAFCICNFPARQGSWGSLQAPAPCAGHSRTGWQPPRTV